ncbi:hypothetical protein D3C80_1675100 [compost metagenome]
MVHVEKENMQIPLQLDDPGAQQRRLAEIKRTNEAADDLLDLSRILFIRLMMLDSKIDLRVNPLNRFALHDFKTGAQRFMPCYQFPQSGFQPV